MTYKIIGDSCLDLTEDMKKDPRFQMIPLTLQVGSAQVVDDETCLLYTSDAADEL